MRISNMCEYIRWGYTMGGVYTMERCAEVCNVLVAPVAEG